MATALQVVDTPLTTGVDNVGDWNKSNQYTRYTAPDSGCPTEESHRICRLILTYQSKFKKLFPEFDVNVVPPSSMSRYLLCRSTMYRSVFIGKQCISLLFNAVEKSRARLAPAAALKKSVVSIPDDSVPCFVEITATFTYKGVVDLFAISAQILNPRRFAILLSRSSISVPCGIVDRPP
jgi:hypothetical protein